MINENTDSNTVSKYHNEIDFMVIFDKIKKSKKILLISIASGLVLGLFLALIIPKSFKVTTTMLPQSESDTGLGKFSSLAAMAGFDLNIGGSTTEISPVVFPQIVESETFLAKLMYSKYKFAKVSEPVCLYDYYKKIKKPGFFDIVTRYTIGLPGLIKDSFKKKNDIKKVSEVEKIPEFSKDEEEILQFMKSNITLMVNKKEGYLTLTCIMPEALLAAQVAEKAQLLLQETITDYKTKSAREQLDFIQQRFNEKKADYRECQQRLAFYKDRNQNMGTAAANAELDRLQGEYDISYAVYSELAKSLEQSKIQVKRETPVFAIIKPVVVPREKYKPRRSLIVAVLTVLGGVIGLSYIFGKEYLDFIKNKNSSKV